MSYSMHDIIEQPRSAFERPPPEYYQDNNNEAEQKSEIPSATLLPTTVYVSGMPFMLQGWNGEFNRYSNKSEFLRPGYTLYGMIPIVGTFIYFRNGRWCFQRACDSSALFFNDSLEGDWAGGFTVSRHESHFKKMLCSMIVLFYCLVFYTGFLSPVRK